MSTTGIRELMSSQGESTPAYADENAPRNNFEKILMEQAPDQFRELKIKKKLNSARGEGKGISRTASITSLLEQKMAGAKYVCLVAKGDPDQVCKNSRSLLLPSRSLLSLV
jgi:hypothetical protein